MRPAAHPWNHLPAALLAAAMAGIAGRSAAADPISANPSYTLAQAGAGKTVYAQHCAKCHGASLEGAEAPALAGQYFESKWAGRTLAELHQRLVATMPASAPGSLSDEQYTDLLALMMQQMLLLPGSEPLPTDAAKLRGMTLPPFSVPFARLEPGVVLPPAPQAYRNPLHDFTPVSAAMLAQPPAQDWLTWRGTETALGYSPLRQITRDNVARLQLAWSWALPNGANQATPLVHDGVLFVYGYGDVVQALDAATGDLLWEYRRPLAKDIAPDFKRALAIYGGNLYTPTSDGHVIALDTRSGEVVWDAAIGPEGTRMSSGPLVARDRVIIGTNFNSGGSYHGGYVVALDAATGKEAWRFATVPGPQDPGGNSWNGLPAERRSGGSVWTPGSYDPDLNLVYFGVGQTYDTGPLRNRKPGRGTSNDALYTDSTLAFDAESGRLAWYYQHMPNDQWDLDWAFERQIVTLTIDGRPTRAVVTAGKAGVHDVLDARTGRYLYSVDAGLQNIITAIDPRTGAKTYDPAKLPGNGATPFVCPHAGGAKSWTPSSYNPESRVVFVPLVEACMLMPPVPAGEGAMLTSGVRVSLVPREHSDGRYGRLQAIDLQNRRTLWSARQRAPMTSGALDTAGGVVFAGSLDRVFSAYDDSTGRRLWDARLGEVPNSAPISYEVDGRQYVAIVVGRGGPQSMVYMSLVPEIRNPSNRSSSLWVFRLPDAR